MINIKKSLKFCNGCDHWKPKAIFGKDKKSKDGLSSRCRPCRLKYRRLPHVKKRTGIYNTRYAKDNFATIKKRTRRTDLFKYWGISEQQFDTMLNSQNGTCAICDKTMSSPFKSLCIDHDHITGTFRGILCDSHNRALGLLGDSIENLKKCIRYIRNHEKILIKIKTNHRSGR